MKGASKGRPGPLNAMSCGYFSNLSTIFRKTFFGKMMSAQVNSSRLPLAIFAPMFLEINSPYPGKTTIFALYAFAIFDVPSLLPPSMTTVSKSTEGC